MNGRDLVLSRIRRSLGDRTDYVVTRPATRNRRRAVADKLIFAERLIDYGVGFSSVRSSGLAAELSMILQERASKCGDRVVLIPEDLVDILDPYGIKLASLEKAAGIMFVKDPQRDGARLDTDIMDRSAGVVTSCSVAITETGTVILDGGTGQGRRALSLVPDFHLCIVPVETLVGGVAEALDHLQTKHASNWPPLTLISGPSATSDIELHRIEGVHGPRILKVVLVD